MGESKISDKKEARKRANSDIKADKFLLIDIDGKRVGVTTLSEALKILAEAQAKVNANEKTRLDLVEIRSDCTPPVVRIMDQGKQSFLQSKQRSAIKKKKKNTKVKEIKFRPGTDKNDYEVKLRNLRGYLEAGGRAKVVVWFRGRELSHQELGLKLLERVRDDLTDCSKVDFMPKLEGRQLIMVLAPKSGQVKTPKDAG